MIVCIQCAMEAMLKGEAYQGEPDADPEAHRVRAHPDLTVTQARRRELEQRLAAKIPRPVS